MLKSPQISVVVDVGVLDAHVGASKSNRISVLLMLLDFSMGGGVTWLAMDAEEAGGIEGTAILPPGGGGSRLRPPDPDTRGLAAPPFFVVMFPMFSLMVCPIKLSMVLSVPTR